MPLWVAICVWALWALVVLLVVTLWLLLQLVIGLARSGAWLARERREANARPGAA
jgi:hypothetical protein